jgi:hypothetical protein
MPLNIREKLQEDLLFDSAVVEHQFTSYLRDHDVIIDVPVARLNGYGAYTEGRYRHATHCPMVQVMTAVRDDV